MSKKKNVPELRFKEFSDEWLPKNLGRIAKFSKGKGISKSEIDENGEIECIRYGELYTKYGEVIRHVYSRTSTSIDNLVLSESNDVIIPASGETQIDIATASCVINSGIALGGDLNIIKTSNNGVFLSYYLNNKRKYDIANLAQGISVVHLYSSQLALLNLNLPSLSEQTKIASFLTSVDDKLQTLKKKKALLEQYKKGVMQKIFSQELRFKDEKGNDFPEWEEKTLGELFKIQSGTSPSLFSLNDEYNIPFIKVEDLNNTFKYQVESRFYCNVNKNSVSKYSIIFPKRGAAILTNKVRINLIDLQMDSNLMAITAKTSNVNIEYVYYLLTFVKLYKIADTSSIPQINNKHIEPYLILFPSLPEQTKIASFLSSLDEKINYCQCQVEKMEVWKKGLLQKMFV